MNAEKVRQYIKGSWHKAVRGRQVEPGFVLPYEYVPPCVDGSLVHLYYWDTYFTNKGLYLDGLARYAFCNIENLKYCLRKFGCVLNMCRPDGAKYASQPPLLFLMVKDHFSVSGDLNFLEDSFEALKLEYSFWKEKRMTKTGLNRYGSNIKRHSREMIERACRYMSERIKVDFDGMSFEEKRRFILDRRGEGESGEDHTPRFSDRSYHINPIDLNSHLYGFERAMAQFSRILGKGEEEVWEQRAAGRKKLLDEHCLDEKTGIYFDYDFERGKRTGIYCAANYLPFIYGISSDKAALLRINEKLVMSHGVLSCERLDAEGVYQWGYPNSWAPHNYFAFEACRAAGLEGEAKRIAQTYIATVAEEFEHTGKLWEKYDAVSGGRATVDEYGTPEMLGWTAGVYNVFFDYLKEN